MDVDVRLGQGGQACPEVLYSDEISEGLLGTDVPLRLPQDRVAQSAARDEIPFLK